MIDQNTTFFSDPKEAWDLLELYKSGRDGPSASAPGGGAQRRTRRQRSRKGQRRKKPSQVQSDRNRREALKATRELTNLHPSDGGGDDYSDHTASGAESELTDALEDSLPGVTPRSADTL